jgi:trehalose 6-phosphate phosphatase
MRHILARDQRATLLGFARSNVLLAFDYDGTLAPIVSEPDRAAMRLRTRRLLSRLAKLYPCVVISGRSRSDLRRRLRGISILRAIGNHGIEAARRQREFRTLVRDWRVALSGKLDGLPGVMVEDKGLSLAIHYRRSRRKARSREAALRSASALRRARVFGGKEVVNVVPRGAPHKGTALENERVRRGCERTLYVGDDETDEDVFSLGAPERLLGIRVGLKAGSRAHYFLRDQTEIDALLERLIGLRAEGGTNPVALTPRAVFPRRS